MTEHPCRACPQGQWLGTGLLNTAGAPKSPAVDLSQAAEPRQSLACQVGPDMASFSPSHHLNSPGSCPEVWQQNQCPSCCPEAAQAPPEPWLPAPPARALLRDSPALRKRLGGHSSQQASAFWWGGQKESPRQRPPDWAPPLLSLPIQHGPGTSRKKKTSVWKEHSSG